MSRTAVAGMTVVREDVGTAGLWSRGEVFTSKDVVDGRQAVIGLCGRDVMDVRGV